MHICKKIYIKCVPDFSIETVDETVEKLKSAAMEIEGVIEIDDIKTRLFGNRIYVDIEICCDGNLTIKEGHDIAEKVHDKIEESNPFIKHCMVHVNPN